MHVTESPKSRSCAALVSLFGSSKPRFPKKSRINIKSRRRMLFEDEPRESLTREPWTDQEIYSLVLFLMLCTDGKSWVAHKDMKFWEDAGRFVKQHSRSSYCRTGWLLTFFITNFNVSLQVHHVDQELPQFWPRSSSHLLLLNNTIFLYFLQLP